MKANGSLLRMTRMEQGRTLSGLARDVGIDKGTLSKVERDLEGLSPGRMRRLALELGLSMDEAAPELRRLKKKAARS